MNHFRLEPVRVTAWVSALLVLLAAFGVPLTPSQHAAILAFAAATMALFVVGAEVARAHVTPNVRLQPSAGLGLDSDFTRDLLGPQLQQGAPQRPDPDVNVE